ELPRSGFYSERSCLPDSAGGIFCADSMAGAASRSGALGVHWLYGTYYCALDPDWRANHHRLCRQAYRGAVDRAPADRGATPACVHALTHFLLLLPYAILRNCRFICISVALYCERYRKGETSF